MKIELLEVYSSDSNYAVIKPPGRNYPGCVIQGDSLAALCRTALNVARQINGKKLRDTQLLENVEELTNALVDRIMHYQRVLDEHHIDYPHVHAFSENDVVKLLPSHDSKE
jgi:hypothetical protein